MTIEPTTPDVAVVARSGVLLLHHGRPYLPLTALSAGGAARARLRPADWGAGRRDTFLAALALGVACAMKYTAWPALAIAAVMVATRDGVRSAARFTGAVLAVTIALVVARLHGLAWFLLACAIAFLVITLADRSLARIGRDSAAAREPEAATAPSNG